MARKSTTKRTTPKKVKPVEDLNLLSSQLGDAEPPKWSASDMLGAYKTVVHHVDICLDPHKGQAKQDAAKVVGRAWQELLQFPNSERAQKVYDDAKQALHDAVEAATEHTVRFTARALPRPEYDELTALPVMRPTDADQQKWKAKCEAEGLAYVPLSFNPTTFPPALMAQCMVEPELTLEQATEIWNEWSDAQAGVLFDLCKRVQRIVY